jgi:hypothetical protein
MLNNCRVAPQDLETAYLGSIVDSKMASGRVVRVVGQETSDNGIKIPKFSEPEPDATVYREGIP